MEVQPFGCESQQGDIAMGVITPTFDIRHRIGVKAGPGEVYARLATPDGLRQWWTQDVRGHAAVGDKLSFHFGGPDRFVVMEVTELAPDERVAWRCVEGPDEWLGTDFTFDLSRDGDETVVLFTNSGWREPVEFMHHCTTKWGSFLVGLKQDVETGAGRPFPNDVKTSNWD
jgi:uncharacterized protein YndB with AHSA1/START domain